MEGAASSSIVLKLQVLQKIHIFFISCLSTCFPICQAETEALLFMTNSNWMERSRSKKTRQNFLALDIKNRTPKSILLCTFSQLLQCWDLCQGGSTNPSSLICLIIWHFWHPCLLCYVARVTRFLQIKLQTWFPRFLRIGNRAQLV